MNNKVITVSKLPNITIYSGEYAEDAGSALENREVGHFNEIFGYLTRTTDNDYYWSYMRSDTIFTENETHYDNVGDIMKSTIAYMDKFKDNKVDIDIEKNVITFNFNYEDDLDNVFNNTYIVPTSKLYELLQNANEMTFNKKAYYKNNNEIYDITYAHKNYPYNKLGTKYTVNEKDAGNNDIVVEYDFSGEYVDYKYSVTSYEEPFISYVYHTDEAGNPDPNNPIPGSAYTDYRTAYTYSVSDVNYLEPRIFTFFENNTNTILNDVLDNNKDNLCYSIYELDTELELTLNTLSLGRKKLIAYINFDSKYNNWYNNTIQFITNQKLESNDEIKITPIEEDYFNVTAGRNQVFGTDVLTDTEHTFTNINNEGLENNETFDIINPKKIKKLDLSGISNKIEKIDFIHNYNKQVNVNETVKSNWQRELSNIEIESIDLSHTEESKIAYINGITTLRSLKEIDITNCKKLARDFSLYNLTNLESFKAANSSRKTFVPRANQSFTNVVLPENINTISLDNITIDQFDYTPNEKLVNLTLINKTQSQYVSGSNQLVSEFINTWITALENKTTQTKVGESSEISYLKSGLINNTILTNIQLDNYDIEHLVKMSYLGINLSKFSGQINITGSDINSYLTRHEYRTFKRVWGDQNTPMNFTYHYYESIFNKYIAIDYNYGSNSSYQGKDTQDGPINNTKSITIENTDGGHSLFDYIENGHNVLESTTKNIENFGFEFELQQKISTDISNSQQTKQANAGEILLYKGNKLIFVLISKTNTIYNYIKLGTFTNINNMNSGLYNLMNKLKISF